MNGVEEIKKAIDILTPGKIKYNPQEYDNALEIAKYALRELLKKEDKT